MPGEIAVLGRIIEDDDPRDRQIELLKRQVRDLERARDDAERKAERAGEDAQRAMKMLRQQLGPLYRALQAVFGELDAAGVTEAAFPPGQSVAAPTNTAKWDEWKVRLGPSCAKVIDALLLGDEMNARGIVVAARMGLQTVYEATSKMGRAGILIKNGGKFSLKQL